MQYLFVAIAVVIVLEIVIVKIVRTHAQKKREQMTVEQLGVTKENLLLALKNEHLKGVYFEHFAEVASTEDKTLLSETLRAVLEGYSFRIDRIHDYLKAIGETELVTLKGTALNKLAKDTEGYLRALKVDETPEQYFDYRFRARMDKHGEAAKIFDFLSSSFVATRGLICQAAGEVDQETIPEMSICIGCGNVEFGRHSAFCTICATPGFEFKTYQKASGHNPSIL
jgi:rubrerythrin